MADAYKVLFEHKICHRDIKPENILLSDKSDVGFCAKLADFDFAKVTQSESQSFKSLKGTLDYMAPEIASAIWEDKKEYDSRVDVWSFGLVFHECFTGKLLFDSKLKSEIIPMVQRKKNLRKVRSLIRLTNVNFYIFVTVSSGVRRSNGLSYFAERFVRENVSHISCCPHEGTRILRASLCQGQHGCC